MCNGQPIADAGVDQTVMVDELVTLDGSASSDPEGTPLTFAWAQIAGPAVTLTGADTDMPTFTAPTVADDTVLTFELTVTDTGGAPATDYARSRDPESARVPSVLSATDNTQLE